MSNSTITFQITNKGARGVEFRVIHGLERRACPAVEGGDLLV